jgi:putative phosphoribosyl transferase
MASELHKSYNKDRNEIVRIPIDVRNKIEGSLTLPTEPKGIVIFAHGSGSGRHSPRNKYVAQVLNESGIATLLIDLLTPEEEKIDNITREHRFDINLLSRRLIGATDWISQCTELSKLKVGYFGASTGAAAALVAAVERADLVYAVVSRGGRPDLATSDILVRVEIPTLLIVGGNDKQVIDLNEKALKQLTKIDKKKKLITIPKATHLFEEPGALEEAAKHASGWFQCFFLEEKR